MTERKGPTDWESWIEQQIREAQARGEFDDLPGKGKPLDLTPNPYAGDQELAFKVLKDAGCAPEWIELGKVIQGKLERAQAALKRSDQQHRARLAELESRADQWAEVERRRSEERWQRAVALFAAKIEAINQVIAEYNLKVPNMQFQRFKIDATREMKRLEAETL